MQDRMEESRLKDFSNQEEKIINARERELLRYRDVMQKQEQELDAYRARLKEEQLQREKEMQKELEAREKFFADREKKLLERQRSFEKHLMHRQAEAEELRDHLQKEVSNREAKLQQALIELQQEKDRYNEENRKKLERTSKDYVSDTLETLRAKETQFHHIAKLWSCVGAGAMALGVVFFGYITLVSANTLPEKITWELLAFSVFKGLIAIALLAGLAKYSLLFSRSYMQEALKNADRRHAINFGKFYLESYGAAAEWSQVKEAFEHWNIDGANAFTNFDGPSDVSSLEKAVAVVERANKAMPRSKKDE